MSAPIFINDSRLRTLSVILPAFCVLIYVGAKFASEEYLVPALIVGVFITGVLFSIFAKNVRIEALIVGFLLIGYLIGNRGFAEVSPMKPIYVGEAGLAGALASMGVRFLLKRETPDFSTLLSRLILLFLFMGALRFAFDVREHGMEAARDFALVYYCIFYFIAEQAGRQEGSQRLIDRCLVIGFIGLAIVYVITRVDSDLLDSLHVGDLSLLTQKDDLTSTFAAAGAFYFYLRPPLRGGRWIGGTLIILLTALVFNGFTRSSLVALLSGTVLCWLAGRRSIYTYIAVALVLGVTYLSGYSVLKSGTGGVDQFAVMEDKVLSIIDFAGNSEYQSDYGREKSDDNEFRRVFWRSVFDETNESHPLVGLGFGYDFTRRFEQIYGRGEWEGLRSPHSYFVTVYGRMGILGFLMLMAISYLIVKHGIIAAFKVRAGEMEARDLFYWCAAWVILVSAGFGVVLEGPMGAIIFWSLLGLAVSRPGGNQPPARLRALKGAPELASVEAAPGPLVLAEYSQANR